VDPFEPSVASSSKLPKPDSTSTSNSGGKEAAAKASSAPSKDSTTKSKGESKADSEAVSKETTKVAGVPGEQDKPSDPDAYEDDNGFICECESDSQLLSDLIQ
jgi:hypothetical protein